MGGVEVSLMGGLIPPRSRNSVRFEDMQEPTPNDGTYTTLAERNNHSTNAAIETPRIPGRMRKAT